MHQVSQWHWIQFISINIWTVVTISHSLQCTHSNVDYVNALFLQIVFEMNFLFSTRYTIFLENCRKNKCLLSLENSIFPRNYFIVVNIVTLGDFSSTKKKNCLCYNKVMWNRNVTAGDNCHIGKRDEKNMVNWLVAHFPMRLLWFHICLNNFQFEIYFHLNFIYS